MTETTIAPATMRQQALLMLQQGYRNEPPDDLTGEVDREMLEGWDCPCGHTGLEYHPFTQRTDEGLSYRPFALCPNCLFHYEF